MRSKSNSKWNADCVFTDWFGDSSPLGVLTSSIANVVGTVFRNMWLQREIADVSWGGVIHFENVKLANVTISTAHVVSTSASDYQPIPGYDAYYDPEDDAEFDVEFVSVPVANRGLFGEEFRIGDQIMSDCLSRDALNDTILPGCPPSSVQRRREREAQRVLPLDYGYDDFYRIDDYIPTQDDPWLLAVEAELGPLPPPPPGWPPFKVTPPENPVVRTSLAELRPVPPGIKVPQLELTPEAVGPFRKSPDGTVASSAWVSLVVVAALVVGIAAAAALWAARTLRQPPAAPPRSSTDVFAHPWPRRFPYWTVRLLPPDRDAWYLQLTDLSPGASSLCCLCGLASSFKFIVTMHACRLNSFHLSCRPKAICDATHGTSPTGIQQGSLKRT